MVVATCRKIYAEIKINDNFFKHKKRKDEVLYGLIIGQYTPSLDLVTHLSRTFNRGHEPPRHLTLIKEKFVQRHALEITRMLPGGFWVLGIYILTTEDIFATSSYNNRFLELLKAIESELKKEPHLDGNPPTKHRLVCHIDHTSEEFVCKAMNLDDGSMVDTMWTFEPVRKMWLIGTYMWNNIPAYQVSRIKSKTNKSQEERLRMELNEFRKNVENCDFRVTGKKAKLDDDLIDYTILENNKDFGERDRIFHYNIYMCNDIGAPTSPPDPPETPEELSCYGVLTCKIYMNREATVKDGLYAVKCDLYRSWAARLDRHLTYLQRSPSKYIDHPRKVLVRTNPKLAHFLFYLFPGEATSNEALKKEIKTSLGTYELERLIAYDPYASKEVVNAPAEDEMDNVKVVFFILSVLAMFLGLIYYSIYPQEAFEKVYQKEAEQQ